MSATLRKALADHRPALLRHCYRMLGSFEDAEDPVQESLTRAWSGRKTFAGKGSLKNAQRQRRCGLPLAPRLRHHGRPRTWEGPVAHASKSIVINVTRDQLFDVIVDYAHYPEFLPEVKKTSVSGNPPDALVTYQIDIKATKINYTVQMTTQRPSTVAWTMTKGEMMKENRGSWTLKEVPGGTEATYQIDLKLGALVPGFVEQFLAEQSLPGLLANFKARAEKLHPKAGA